MRDVQIDMIFAPQLHLLVDGTGNDVARSQRESRVIFVHEFLPVERPEHTAVAAHGFRDEEAGAIAGVKQGRRVELDEFHVLHSPLGAINHCDAVARRYQWICGVAINRLTSTCCHDGDAREEGFDLARLLVQDVGAETFDAGRVAGDDNA